LVGPDYWREIAIALKNGAMSEIVIFVT